MSQAITTIVLVPLFTPTRDQLLAQVFSLWPKVGEE